MSAYFQCGVDGFSRVETSGAAAECFHRAHIVPTVIKMGTFTAIHHRGFPVGVFPDVEGEKTFICSTCISAGRLGEARAATFQATLERTTRGQWPRVTSSSAAREPISRQGIKNRLRLGE